MRDKYVGYMIKNINDRLKANVDADLKHWNLTLAHSRVLAFLHRKGSYASQKEIMDFLEVSHPTVVGIVSRMEQNGYVVTCQDGRDKRNKIVHLTERARTILDEMMNNIEKNEKRLVESLTEEEVAQLKRLLNIIYHNLE